MTTSDGHLDRREVINAVLLAKLTAVRALVARDGTDGQGLAEYALILALIAVVCIVAVTFMGTQVAGEMSVIGSTVESVR